MESRVRRVAGGSGREEEEVRALVGRFLAMRDMFGVLGVTDHAMTPVPTPAIVAP